MVYTVNEYFAGSVNIINTLLEDEDEGFLSACTTRLD